MHAVFIELLLYCFVSDEDGMSDIHGTNIKSERPCKYW